MAGASACDYCGHDVDADLVVDAYGVATCRDAAACEVRENEALLNRADEIRARIRAGDEPTEAEREVLRDARLL